MEKNIKYTIIIVFAGLVLRVGLGFVLQDGFYDRGNRNEDIVSVAKNLVVGNGFVASAGNPTAENEPLYISMIAVVIAVFGYSWWSILIMHSLLYILGAYIMYRISRCIYGDSTWALLPLLLYSIYPFFITQSVSVVDTTLFTVLLIALVYIAGVVKQNGKSWRLWVLSGIIAGMLIATRQGGVVIVAAVVGSILYVRGLKRSWGLVWFTLSLCLVVAPWITRNYLHTGKIFFSTHGGIEMYFAFNDSTVSVLSKDVTVDVMRRNPDLQNIKIPEEYKENSLLAEYAINKEYMKIVYAYIVEDPWRALAMMPLKLWKYWSWSKTPRTNSQDDSRSNLSVLWDNLYPIYYVPVFVLGILGLAVLLKRNRDWAFLLISIIVMYSFMHAVVYGFTRLRIPQDVLLMIAVPAAIQSTIDYLQRCRLNKKRAD